MRYPFKYCLFFILLFLASNLLAQNHSYRQYTTEDGLPTNYVYGVIEDDEGYIWVYTENGISKFDGYTFQNFSTKNGLLHNDVVYMVKDTFGTLWCRTLGTKGGTYVDNDSIYQVDFKKGALSSVFYQTDKYVLHNCKDTLYAFNKNELIDQFESPVNKLYSKGMELISSTVSKEESYGLIRNKNVFFTYENNQFSTYPINEDLRNIRKYSSSSAFATLQNKQLYITTNPIDFLIINIDNKKTSYHNFEEVLGYKIKHATPEANIKNERCISTDKAFLFIDENGEIDKIFKPYKISQQYTMHRLFIDSQGNYWIGSRDGGLFFIAKKALETSILQTQSGDDVLIEKIYEKDNQLYAVSDNMRIYTIGENELEAYYQPSSKSNFNALIQRQNGNIYYLTGGASESIYWDHERKDFLSIYSSPISSKFKDIRIDTDNFRNGKILAFDEKNRLIFFSNAVRTFVYVQSSKKTSLLTDNFINHILVDTSSSTTYLAKNKTLYNYKNPQLEELAILPDIISTLFVKDSSHLLIGTQNDGLYLYTKKTNTFIKINASTFIRDIEQEGDNYFLATNQGVVQLAEKDETFEVVYQFDKKDGLSSTEIFDVHLTNNYLYAASMRGVMKIDLDKQKTPIKKEGAIQNIQCYVNNQLTDLQDNTSLSHQQNNIKVEYHLTDFASLGNIEYTYRLSPIQKYWTTTKNRHILFENLLPDDYKLELKATDVNGQTSQLSTPLTFCIQKAFWQTVWFYFILFGGSLSLVYWFFKKREAQQLAKLAYEKSLNDRIADLQMESLRSQMNPHFIFNALGSIQYFIQSHQTDEADDFLAMFASLMRKYLDSASERFITLDTEINLLDEYTQLEMMRCRNQFSTEINIEGSIDREHEMIPSMLLQPFVENAILHGLQLRNDKNGKLMIHFSKTENGILSCQIIDTGVGRTNAKKLDNKTHKSRGMKNVFDRIETLKANNLCDISVKIEDYIPDNPILPGTKIMITIKNISDEAI